MRRFRLRRRRIAAAALLPLAATLTTAALAGASAEPKSAQIDASERSVPFGDRIVLRGVFPGAASAPIEIRYRVKGAGAWHTAAHGQTGAAGRYSVRVKPRRSAYWRAELAAAPVAQSGADEPAAIEGSDPAPAAPDADTGNERVSVRSKTRAKIAGRHLQIGRAHV